MEQDTQTRLDDLLTIKTLCRRYPELGTESAVRWQVFRAEENGLAMSGSIVRVGRRILIDGPRYCDWLLGGRVTAA